ncbi:ankyrin repeat-containing domain protein [Aspergillus varians]
MADCEWEPYRVEIKRLYIEENKALKVVAECMSERGFRKTKSQYETQFKKWGLRKKQPLLRTMEWEFIGNRVEKRKRVNGKESEVFIHGERYPAAKLRKAQYGKAFVSTVDKLFRADAPSPSTPEGVVVRTPLSPGENMAVEQCYESLRLTWNLSIPWLQFAKLLRWDQDQDRALLPQHVQLYWSQEIGIKSGMEKTELMQRLGWVVPWAKPRGVNVSSQISATLSILMPEEYEGQHQALVTNRLSLELFLLSNGLRPHGTNKQSAESMQSQDTRLLKMLRSLGWHRLNQFKNLRARKEPTVEAIAEKLFGSAVRLMDMDIVKMMLESGVDPDCPIECGMDPYCRIKCGMDPNCPIKSFEGVLTPLGWAARFENNKGVKLIELLLSYKADVNLRYRGNSALVYAIHENNKAVIEVLMCHRAVVYLPSLVAATRMVDTELFQRLLNSCIDVNGRYYIGLFSGHTTILGAAAMSGRLEITELVLQACPNLVNPWGLGATPDYLSPLSIAVKSRRTGVLEILIQAGVDMEITDTYNRALIEIALEQQNLESCQILLENGAKINRPLSHDSLRTLQNVMSHYQWSHESIDQLFNRSAGLNGNSKGWYAALLAAAIEDGDHTTISVLQDVGVTVSGREISRIKDKETAQYLDGRGALQGILDTAGARILLEALGREELEVAWWLIDRDPDILNNGSGSTQTPLSSAVELDDLSLVEVMVSRGARVTDDDLTDAVDYILLEGRDIAILQRLLIDFQGQATSAVGLSCYGKRMDLLQLFLSAGADPTGVPKSFWEGHGRDKDWYITELVDPQSVLEMAVAGDNKLIVDFLLQSYHWGPKWLGRALVMAIYGGAEELVDEFLKLNPYMNEEVATRRSPYRQPRTFTALQAAVQDQQVSVVRKLVEITNIEINHDAKGPLGRTALQYAVENGDLEMINMLLTHGADVNNSPARNSGATALQLAAIKGYLGIARKLIDLGAQVNAAGAKIEGRTALEGAAEYGRIDMVQMLLDEGALIFGTTGKIQYRNAISLAKNNGCMATVRLLESFKRKAELTSMQLGISDNSDNSESSESSEDSEYSDF